MSAINGNYNSGFNQSQMMQRMQQQEDKFKAADTDGNESVSKSEFSSAMEDSGMNVNKIDQKFDQMDTNGDGEVSLQERQDMIEMMQQRMGGMKGQGGGGGHNKDNYDSVTTLLESLQSDSDNEDEKTQLQDMLDKMRSRGRSQSAMSDSLNFINEILPGVDETV